MEKKEVPSVDEQGHEQLEKDAFNGTDVVIENESVLMISLFFTF